MTFVVYFPTWACTARFFLQKTRCDVYVRHIATSHRYVASHPEAFRRSSRKSCYTANNKLVDAFSLPPPFALNYSWRPYPDPSVLPWSYACRPCATHFGCDKVLEERDLEPVMAKMREQLMSRNVASEVANDITASVQATLLNQKLRSFTRWAHTIACLLNVCVRVSNVSPVLRTLNCASVFLYRVSVRPGSRPLSNWH